MSALGRARAALAAFIFLWVAALFIPRVAGDEAADDAMLVGVVAGAGMVVSAVVCLLLQFKSRKQTH